MIYLLTVLEMMSAFIFYNILFNHDFKKKLLIKILVSILLATIFYFLPFDKNSLIRISIFVVQGVILSFIDKKEVFISIIGISLSSLIVAITELIGGGLTFILVIGKEINDYFIFLILAISFIIGVFLINQFNKRTNVNLEKYLNNHRLLCIFIINVLVFLLFVLIGKEEIVYFNKLYFEYIVLGLFLILANSYCYKNLYKDLQIKRELEINAQYQCVIDELLDKFREDEHEYKNHLNTLNAMVALSDDQELKSNVSEYIMNVKEQATYSKLMYIKSTILKAILYNKIRECEEKGIKFTYDVICDFDEAPLDNTEQTVLLNNLLNNAIEAVEMLSEKYINLKIVQGVKYEVMVENNLGQNVVINQSEMFKKGMSSKGDGRGFGLYNIKKIVERYKGTIQLSTNKGFLRIQVTINKSINTAKQSNEFNTANNISINNNLDPSP